jgi:hypothetical protein
MTGERSTRQTFIAQAPVKSRSRRVTHSMCGVCGNMS